MVEQWGAKRGKAACPAGPTERGWLQLGAGQEEKETPALWESRNLVCLAAAT